MDFLADAMNKLFTEPKFFEIARLKIEDDWSRTDKVKDGHITYSEDEINDGYLIAGENNQTSFVLLNLKI